MSASLRCSHVGGHLALDAWTGGEAVDPTGVCGRREAGWGRGAARTRERRCGWRRVRSAASGGDPRRRRGEGRSCRCRRRGR